MNSEIEKLIKLNVIRDIEIKLLDQQLIGYSSLTFEDIRKLIKEIENNL